MTAAFCFLVKKFSSIKKGKVLIMKAVISVTGKDGVGIVAKVSTKCAEYGVNIIDISDILGHAKSSTTMDIYAHSFEKQKKEATSKLEEFLAKQA